MPPSTASLHPVDDRVVDLVVRDVPPPGEHVGVVEHVLREAVLGLLERRRAHARRVAEPGGQPGGDRRVHAVGIDGAHVLLRALVDVLAPDRDPNHPSNS